MKTYEIVQKVLDYYFVQDNKFGYDAERKQCTYFNNKTGSKCAIGCLLTDPEAFQDIVGQGSVFSAFSSYHHPEAYEMLLEIAPSDLTDEEQVRYFFSALQETHDGLAEMHYDSKEKLKVFKDLLFNKLESDTLSDVAQDLRERGIL